MRPKSQIYARIPLILSAIVCDRLATARSLAWSIATLGGGAVVGAVVAAGVIALAAGVVTRFQRLSL
jgi:hypothetical protein